jgi:hypothetical protein
VEVVSASVSRRQPPHPGDQDWKGYFICIEKLSKRLASHELQVQQVRVKQRQETNPFSLEHCTLYLGKKLSGKLLDI